MTAEIASDAYRPNFAKLIFVAQRQFKSPLTKYKELLGPIQPIIIICIIAREAGTFTGPHLFII